MKVVLTDQSLDRLENTLRFYLEELQIPKNKVIEIKSRLFCLKNLHPNLHLPIAKGKQIRSWKELENEKRHL